MSSPSSEPDGFTYAGLFLTTLALLQLELFLTRVFSVTMWYHFAFMAISLAMLGLAAGAVLVEVVGTRDPYRALATSGLLFALTSAVCFALQLALPSRPGLEVAWTAVAFAVIAVPFVFAGVVICVALTRFPAHTPALYAADLAGSAAGCVLTIPILDHVHAPTAVILNAAIAALGAGLFRMRGLSVPDLRRAGPALAVCAALLVAALANASTRIVDIRWVKDEGEVGRGLYEKWNALSRIYVGSFSALPFGWGLSPLYTPRPGLEQLYLYIDSGAGSVITRFDGRLDTLDHLRYDVTGLAHHLRRNASVLIIGVGGGRDVLTGLVFGQKQIVGVEINRDIIDVLTNRFADYAGHLHRLPGVTLVHDEARSYVTRSRERYDIIQASFTDTWAATAAGAYVLTENGLYTKEAWITFLQHLSPDGILTVSRWWDEGQPAEVLRVVALATESLAAVGASDPRQHIAIVRNKRRVGVIPGIVATVLVSRRPFTAEETARLTELARTMDFVPVLTPELSVKPEFVAMTTPAQAGAFVRGYPLNIAAPTDDTPFFFNMLRARDLVRRSTYKVMNEVQLRAVKVLGASLGIVVALSAVAILAPLALSRRVRVGQSPRLMVYFAAIGLGFMMIEIGQLERLILFLGHPIYGLTVVLFVVLIASSAGSLCANRLGRLVLALPAVLAAFIYLGPVVTREVVAAPASVRVAVAAALLIPSGFLMGMAFPLGLAQARRDAGAPTAWYWAINGAFSVISSVLAVAVAVFWGITATLLIGLLAYLVALAALGAGFVTRRSQPL